MGYKPRFKPTQLSPSLEWAKQFYDELSACDKTRLDIFGLQDKLIAGDLAAEAPEEAV